MTARQWARNLAWIAPAAFASVVGAPFVLVVILSVIATLAVGLRMADRLLDDRTEPPPRARRSAFAAAAAPRRPPPVKPPADLRRMETLVAARLFTAAGVHYWLRPLLVDIAVSRVRRHGDTDLRDPKLATSVPDPLWALVRPGPGRAGRARRSGDDPARARRGSSTSWRPCDAQHRGGRRGRAGAVLDAVEQVVVGKRPVLELVLMGLLANGHVLIEDVPGVAKTMIARTHGAGDRPRLLPHPVHARHAAVGRDRLESCSSRIARSSSGRARSSPTWCWATRSTAPLPRPRPPCSRRWPSAR